MPDGAAAVVGYVEAAVGAYGYAYGAAPDLAVGGYEAGEEVVVFAGGVAVLHGDDDDFVAGAVGAVPAAVLGGEGITVVGRGEGSVGPGLGGVVGIEGHLEGGHVGLDEDVGGADFGGHVDALAVFGFGVGEGLGEAGVGAGAVGAGLGEARVLVASHVVPGPAEEAALRDGGDVVGDEVVAEVVALVGGAPEGAGDGVDGFADAVAEAAGVDADELAVGGVLEDVGAVELAGMGVGVVYVGAGAYGDEQVLVVLGEDDVAGPVAAAAELGVAGDVGDDGLGLAGGVEVAIFVGEALDGGGVADVDVLRVGAGGVEGDAEGVVEAGGEFFDGGGFAVGGDAAEDEDGAGAGVGEEEIAVGGGGDEAGLGEGAVGELHVLAGGGALEGRGSRRRRRG